MKKFSFFFCSLFAEVSFLVLLFIGGIQYFGNLSNDFFDKFPTDVFLIVGGISSVLAFLFLDKDNATEGFLGKIVGVTMALVFVLLGMAI